MASLRVFAFTPDWGLPTTGPFALKLLAWLQLAGIPYEQVTENRPDKGPAGKSPWIEVDGRRVADSRLIIELLSERHGFDIDADLSPQELAEAHAWRRAFEEGFHQVLEWELFVHPAGRAYIASVVRAAAPGLVAPLLTRQLCSHFEKQLRARGVGRFPPDEVGRIGRAELDALATRLQDRLYFFGDRPHMVDLAVFGQVAPLVRWPMRTPVADHAKQQAAIVGFVDRLRNACFAEGAAAA
ncbi:MAG: glutathione S-transferase family protein [Ectothiorhodospiraceae bacterium]|nr:glutathione S-transferase family protein [Ectothiorhodospiraceae bacterium]